MVADLCMASPAAVELVNPKHRNERKTHMASSLRTTSPAFTSRITASTSPLTGAAWSRCSWPSAAPCAAAPMPAPIAGAPESIKLFYRVVCAPDRINDDLPLLLFLQGGPGGESRVRCRPQATAGSRRPSSTSAWSFPTSAAPDAAAAWTDARSRHWVIAQRPPAPIQHARRRTSSSATSPAPSCAILSTCA